MDTSYMTEFDSCECDNCHQLLFTEYIDHHDDIHMECYTHSYLTDDGILCGECSDNCKECFAFINNNYEYCHECEHKILIKDTITTTVNDITKALPVELVHLILNFI
jgi:tRNA G26 N,N-dimethylase Trm1